MLYNDKVKNDIKQDLARGPFFMERREYMQKFANWDFSEDMISEIGIVPTDELLTEEREEVENGENSL